MHSCGRVLFGFHFPRGYLCECAVGAWCGVGRASCSPPIGVHVGALVHVVKEAADTVLAWGLFEDDGWLGWRR